MWFTYDQMFSEMNSLNRAARPSKRVYFQRNPRLSKAQKQTFQEDFHLMKESMLKHQRMRNFFTQVQVKVKFFDDANTVNSIENAYPHTVGETIQLPIHDYFRKSQSNRVILLIHECFHIYQRWDPFAFNKLLIEILGLAVIGFTMKMHDDQRSNPDINRLTYAIGDQYNVALLQPRATNLARSSVHTFKVPGIKSDGSGASASLYTDLVEEFQKRNYPVQVEHPYETMACIFAVYIYESQSWDGSSSDVKLLNSWLSFV